MSSRRPEERATADVDPVARLVVDVSLQHLDRPFDYLVARADAGTAVPGARVRVRFAGKLVDAWVLQRRADSDHEGRLALIERVISPEPVLSTEVFRLCRATADRYAGVVADVLRLALPSRRASVEAETFTAAEGAVTAPAAGAWQRYADGASYLDAVADGRTARAVFTAGPGEDWPARLAEAAQAALAGARGAILVVPDGRDLGRLDVALTQALGPGRHVALSADLGATARYRRWLSVRRGAVRVVAGTRTAAFAPVTDLGLAAIWDDGDDLHAEPRAPYPHVRDVLALRSHQTGCALLIAGTARTAEGARLVESGWTRAVALPRAEVRTVAPRVVAAGDDEALARDSGARGARLPSVAWQAARTALAAHSPVLVQVPRRGYAPCLSCDRCRAPARCARCSGPLAATSGPAVPACRWCGQVAGGWECGHCGGTRMRAAVVGARRTAEELGRAFPGAVVRTSGRGEVLASVAPEPALVVATPGAEPVVPGGYGAAVLLDAWALLTRADLRAGEETVRRWCNAATLVRAGGDVVIVGADSGLAAVQALVRWDPAGFAARELGERAELGFPPAVRMAAVTGPRDAVADVIERASLPGSAGILGPVPVEVPRDSAGAAGEQERTLVRVPIGDGPALAAALRAAAGVRSARKLPGSVRIQIDPAEIG